MKGIGIGIGIGVLLGILLAPQSGKETRAMIKEKIEELKAQLEEAKKKLTAEE